GGQVQLVAVGDAAGRHQQHLPGDVRAVVQADAHAPLGLLGTDDAAVDDVAPLSGQLVEPLVQVLVEVPQQRGAGAARDLRAECVEDVGELQRDVATPDDHQGLGQLGQPHDVLVGVEVHPRGGDGLGNEGPRASGDDDLTAGDDLLLGA